MMVPPVTSGGASQCTALDVQCPALVFTAMASHLPSSKQASELALTASDVSAFDHIHMPFFSQGVNMQAPGVKGLYKRPSRFCLNYP